MIWGLFLLVAAVAGIASAVMLSGIGILVALEWVDRKLGGIHEQDDDQR